MPAFPGFPVDGMTFLKQLKKNNNRDWFQPRKETFDEKVKAPMVDFVQALNAWLSEVAPDFVTDPQKAIYRIYRDTRFSKDKTPYKTHIAASFSHQRLGKHTSTGYYMGVSPEGVEVAGGIYMPEPEQILTIRNLLAESYSEFGRITGGKQFRVLMGELHGEQLTRIPKGFPADHPAEGLLRRKQWYWYMTLDQSLATSPKLFGEIRKRFQILLPAVEFFNAPLVAQRKKEAARAMM